MTSFLASTFAVLANEPETICAVLATSREIMNCSAVPVTLSSDKTWDLLCPKWSQTEKKLLHLFSIFSDTMQFTEKLRIQNVSEDKDFVKGILENLIKNKRYFARTIRVLELPSANALIEACYSCSNSSTRATPETVFRNLQSLSIRCSNSLQDEQLETICTLCPFLEDLNMPLQYQLTDEGVEFLTNLKHLKVLDLSCCKLISGFNHLAKLSSLKSLNLHQCKITNDGLEHLAKLSSLQLLNLGVCQLITDRGLEFLANLSSLQSLNLNTISNITDTGLKHLLKLPSLQSLNLSYCENITDNGLQHLAQLSSLQSLNLKYCGKITDYCGKITDEGRRVFSESMKVIR